MGATYQCDICNDEPAAILLTSLDDGDVQAVGANCLPGYMRTVADVLNPPETDAPVPVSTEPPASDSGHVVNLPGVLGGDDGAPPETGAPPDVASPDSTAAGASTDAAQQPVPLLSE